MRQQMNRKEEEEARRTPYTYTISMPSSSSVNEKKAFTISSSKAKHSTNERERYVTAL